MTDSSRRDAHFFTVDVEEHFQVSAFDRLVSRDAWPSMPSRVVRNTELLLDLLAAYDVRGTFFVLGCVAERTPDVVRRIARGGHEIASHGWSHRRITTLTEPELREELRSSKARLEDLAGQRVRGFRAPSFSIVPGRAWAFDALIAEGYEYDSSVFPIRRRGYGYARAYPYPHLVLRDNGAILELPMATLKWIGGRIPAAGGGYLRHFPLGVVQRAFRAHGARHIPGVLYIHPWEVDPEQPRIPAGFVTRMRHYHGLEKTMGRLEALLAEFAFAPIAPALDALRLVARQAPATAGVYA